MTEDTTAAPAPSYSVGDAVGYGWRKFEQHWQKVFGYGIIVGIPVALLWGGLITIYFVTGHWTTTTDSYGNDVKTFSPSGGGFALSAVLDILFYPVTLVLKVGLVRATTRILDGNTFALRDILSFNRVWTVFLASLLIGLGTLIGLVFCVIPGLIFAFLSYYATWFIVDRNQGPVEAIKSSIAMVRGNLGAAFLFMIVAFLVLFAGYVACLVGIFVAVPVIQIATGYTYRKLSGAVVE